MGAGGAGGRAGEGRRDARRRRVHGRGQGNGRPHHRHLARAGQPHLVLGDDPGGREPEPRRLRGHPRREVRGHDRGRAGLGHRRGERRHHHHGGRQAGGGGCALAGRGRRRAAGAGGDPDDREGMQARARPCVVVPARFPDEGRRGHGRHGGRGGDAGRRLRGGGGRHRRLGGRREQGGLRAGERRNERLLVGRHVSRAQRRGLPGRRREPHPAARGARGLGLRMRHLRGGRGRRRAQRGGARGRAGRADHLRGGPGPARRQRPGGRHVRHPRRLEAAGVQALRVPQLSLRRAQAGRLGHRRVPLRLRPAAHPPHRGGGRPLHRLDGRLRRALALGRGAGVRGTEELDARPPRAQDEGRHRRHVRVRSAPRRAVPLPEPGRGARAGRRRPRRGRGGSRGLRRGEVHPRRARRHPHGGRLLQQQGALAALHTHGGHGLRHAATSRRARRASASAWGSA